MGYGLPQDRDSALEKRSSLASSKLDIPRRTKALPCSISLRSGLIEPPKTPKVCIYGLKVVRPCRILHPLTSILDDQFSTQVLQTVAAGQQAENFLDFDDIPLDQPSGPAAPRVSAVVPMAASPIAGTPSDPPDNPIPGEWVGLWG